MADGSGATRRRYSAFISYSRADAAFAQRLHRRLETYRLPHRLARASGLRRLKPVFRDTDELAASGDLTEVVRKALEDSDVLIVVCSPRSAQSTWVGREIELFRRLPGERPILAALIEGEPETAFHASLRPKVRGHITEPLAADFRPGADAPRLALLKLIAPLAGVSLDDLIHRDGQRRSRQVLLSAGAAVAATAIVVGLGLLAINARQQAHAEQAKSESLVSFMDSSLRDELKSAGRLDIRARIDQQAEEYFRGKSPKSLGDTELQKEADTEQHAGEDAEQGGDFPGAQRHFETERRITAALLAKNPSDGDRIYNHAQSEYWVAFINWRRGDRAQALVGFEAYAALAARVARLDPRNDKWALEPAYAAKNLGMMALRQAGDVGVAEQYFRRALAALDGILSRSPNYRPALIEKADEQAWLADCLRLQGDYAGALASRQVERSIYERILADKSDAELKTALLGYQLAIARIDAARGDVRKAIVELDQGRDTARALAAADPTNAHLASRARIFELFKVRMLLSLPASHRPSPRALAAILGTCPAVASNERASELADFCLTLQARLAAAQGDRASASRLADEVAARQASNVYSARWGLDFKQETGLIRTDLKRGAD